VQKQTRYGQPQRIFINIEFVTIFCFRFLILNGFSMIAMAVMHVLLIDFILDPISYCTS